LTVVPAKLSTGGEGGGCGSVALGTFHGGVEQVSIRGGGGGGGPGPPLITPGGGLVRPSGFSRAVAAYLNNELVLEESLSLLSESKRLSLSLDDS
jgi:hypothetical protein